MKSPALWIASMAMLVAAMTGGGEALAQRSAAPNRGRPAATQTARPASAATAQAAEGVVNLNTATETELCRLPGIGPSRAEAILALRQRVQRFRSVDDLVRVKGIGRASMRKLRPYLTLTGDTTLTARPRRAARTARASSSAESVTSNGSNVGGSAR
jgi:competence protein ComEA